MNVRLRIGLVNVRRKEFVHRVARMKRKSGTGSDTVRAIVAECAEIDLALA